jgi:hypothetical protein
MTTPVRLDTDLTYEAAVDLDERLTRWRDSGIPLAVRAYQGRIWLQLGYASWEAYCAERLSGFMPALDRGARRDAVVELRGAGMSTRAIGSALGVTDITVRRDLEASATNVAVEAPITGVNGKSYAPSRPEPASRPEPSRNPFQPPTVTPAETPDEAHLRRTSEDLRLLVTRVHTFHHGPTREKYVRGYVESTVRETIPVTSESLRRAGETLIDLAETWKAIHEQQPKTFP